MKITVAKTAGFCFGVNRAVQTVHRLLEEGEQVWTLGPIIHNPQTLRELEARGVRVAHSPAEAQGGVLVIRSHGVPAAVMEEARRLGLRVVDAPGLPGRLAPKAAGELIKEAIYAMMEEA